jgi:hypothetical protein
MLAIPPDLTRLFEVLLAIQGIQMSANGRYLTLTNAHFLIMGEVNACI